MLTGNSRLSLLLRVVVGRQVGLGQPTRPRVDGWGSGGRVGPQPSRRGEKPSNATDIGRVGLEPGNGPCYDHCEGPR
jgi:hypothetical protein